MKEYIHQLSSYHVIYFGCFASGNRVSDATKQSLRNIVSGRATKINIYLWRRSVLCGLCGVVGVRCAFVSVATCLSVHSNKIWLERSTVCSLTCTLLISNTHTWSFCWDMRRTWPKPLDNLSAWHFLLFGLVFPKSHGFGIVLVE